MQGVDDTDPREAWIFSEHSREKRRSDLWMTRPLSIDGVGGRPEVFLHRRARPFPGGKRAFDYAARRLEKDGKLRRYARDVDEHKVYTTRRNAERFPQVGEDLRRAGNMEGRALSYVSHAFDGPVRIVVDDRMNVRAFEKPVLVTASFSGRERERGGPLIVRLEANGKLVFQGPLRLGPDGKWHMDRRSLRRGPEPSGWRSWGEPSSDLREWLRRRRAASGSQ